MSIDTDSNERQPSPVVIERHVEVPAELNRRRALPFIAGVLAALIAVAAAIVVFLAVSDADDGGNIELDVPAVDVEVQD